VLHVCPGRKIAELGAAFLRRSPGGARMRNLKSIGMFCERAFGVAPIVRIQTMRREEMSQHKQEGI
jgi:hypothetical protein